MKTFRWLLALIFVVLIASLALAATSPGTTPPATKLMSQKVLNANAWEIYTTNYGPFVFPQVAAGGGFWPAGSGCNYICGAGLWIGAQNYSGDTIIAVGYNPAGARYEFGPVDTTGDWTDCWTDSSARVYLSTDTTDVSEWQLRDISGNPIIESNQDSYARYNDLNPAFTFSGDSSLKVEVVQTSYALNYGNLNDIIFFHFSVKNISGSRLDSVYIGPCVDADIGDEVSDPNDRTGFDYTRNLAMQFQAEPESSWAYTGVVGFRLLTSPINNTGDTIHIIDNQFSHNIAPNDTLKLTAFKVFPYDLTPTTDEQRYLEMAGITYWDLVNDAYDEWGAVTADDKRIVMSSGPFNLEPNETVKTCFAVMAALDTVTLKALSDSAQKYFDDYVLGIFSNNDNQTVNLHQLLPNAPNPFSHSGTTISYQIGGSGSVPVCLKIYNITGQLVKTLVNDSKMPGHYNAVWNGKAESGQKVSAGIYIYRLQAGDKSLTKKMVLIK